MRTPPREADLSDINSEAARTAMAAAAKEGRALLTEPEAKAVLRAYGIPTVPTLVAATPQEVEATAGELLEHAPFARRQGAVGGHLAQIGRWRRAPWAAIARRRAGGCRGHQEPRGRRAGPTQGSKASRCSP